MRYFIGFLVTIGLIILLIVLIFGGGGNKTKVPTTSKPLITYADTDSEVSMTVGGPIRAQSEYREYKIAVNRDNVKFELIKGYQNDVIQSKTYDNNSNAYRNFLAALTRAGFTKGDNNKALKDETALCPLGSRYVFELTQSDEQLIRYWITNCSGTRTYLGNFSMTNSLFQNQVPDFNDLTRNFVYSVF